MLPDQSGTPVAAADDTRLVAVVVTWNRRELLAESLAAVRGQQHAPAVLVVVDNASDDGSADDLAALRHTPGPDLDVVRLAANTGGAGGFAAGIQRALTHRPDLVWLLDDDTVPEPGAAGALVAAWQQYAARHGERPRAVASRVVWTDGRDHPMNTPRPKPGAGARERARAAAVDCVPIRSASFVSVAFDAEAVRERGLPLADYFLWNDDFEYSTRLIRGGVGLYCPASVAVHKTRTFGSTDADPGDRFFYEVRNKIWMFSRSRSLGPAEKVAYGGATLRRWARTVARSSDRPRLLRAAARGIRAGVRAPRPTPAVLAEAGWAPHLDAVPAGQDGVPFSLLISTYGGDRADFLRQAFVSSVQEQTRRPAEVVLVQDGPVDAELAAEIEHLVATSPVPVQHVVCPENRGLGPALDRGLAAASHEVVARMDADDISVPERFARQLPVIEAGADIVGSGLWEFTVDPDRPGDVVGRRTPPVDPGEIRRVIGFRDPFNHPTVVYRRSAVLAAGGYTHLALMEDYLLFARMVAAGAVPANRAEPLVYYRVGDGAYARRGGARLLRSDLALQRRFRQLGITTRRQYLRNVVVRGGYRLVPEHVRKVAYRALLANRSGAAGSGHSRG